MIHNSAKLSGNPFRGVNFFFHSFYFHAEIDFGSSSVLPGICAKYDNLLGVGFLLHTSPKVLRLTWDDSFWVNSLFKIYFNLLKRFSFCLESSPISDERYFKCEFCEYWKTCFEAETFMYNKHGKSVTARYPCCHVWTIARSANIIQFPLDQCRMQDTFIAVWDSLNTSGAYFGYCDRQIFIRYHLEWIRDVIRTQCSDEFMVFSSSRTNVTILSHIDRLNFFLLTLHMSGTSMIAVWKGP